MFIHRTITARISELFYQSTIPIFIIWMALPISYIIIYMKKIIFLDIDGVLNQFEQSPRFLMIDQIKLLRFVMKVTGAHVVIHSSWAITKLGHEIVDLTFKQLDVVDYEWICDPQPSKYFEKPRMITDYLIAHPCDKWIILDDVDEGWTPEQLDHWVHVDYHKALDDSSASEVINRLL